MNVPARRGLPALLALTVALALACTGGSEEGGVAPAAATATAAPAAAAPTAATPTATATPSPTPTATPTAAPSPAPTPDAEPTKLRYNRLDTTGAAATAGSYAFLTTAGDATSAIENFGFLPGRGVELRIHPADASGASRAAFYDTVQVGDTFDYRTNGLDCGFRFKVTSLGATATPRTLGIERLRRYGTRCGDFFDDPGAARDVQFVWRVRTGLPGADGVRVMLVDEPTGPGTYRIARDLPWVIDIPAGAEIVFEGIWINAPVEGSNLPNTAALLRDVATGSTLHIDPETGRAFHRFITSDEVDALFDQIAASIRRVEVGATPATTPAVCTTPADPTCIVAVYEGAPGAYATVADIPAEQLLERDADGRYHVMRGQQVTVKTRARLPAGYTRFYLQLSPLEFGTPSPVSASQLIKPVGTTYTFTPTTDEAGATLITFDLTAARPLPVSRPGVKPELGAAVVTTVFSVEATSPRYSSYDTTGAVATAGSYAFLADPADTTSAVSTYEALRDGTTTALLIHKSDAHGASQAALYDAVEAGDLFEWQQAEDCFVRYRVTDVPAVAATAAYREFGVRPETYAWQSCQSGSLPSGASAVHFTAAPVLALQQLGGTNLTDFAVVHALRQLTPYAQPAPGVPGNAPGSIVLRPVTQHTPPAAWRNVADGASRNLEELRRLPGWRDPAWLPTGVSFDWAEFGGSGSDPIAYGYIARYRDADGYLAVDIRSSYAWLRSAPVPARWTTNLGSVYVREPIVVAGRAGIVQYSPPGANHDRLARIEVEVYDPTAETFYLVSGANGSLGLRGGSPEAVARVVRIACSLFLTASECPAQ